MKRTLLLLLGSLLLAAAAFAQMEPMKPGPEQQKLNYFVGNWTSEGDLKPGPMGPGGKVTSNDDNQWMDGGFFVVFHATFKITGMGGGTGLAFMGYDPQEKVYTYDEFNSMGEATHSKGTFDGDTWSWANDMKMGPQTMKARYSMKIVSPTSYTFKFEVSPDGTNWTLVMDGKATKNK
ncbi:MAG: DUF1579 family protein [Terriglobales bacterium]